MTRSADKVWEDIKNSHLNIGTTTTPVRLNYWDGRDLFRRRGRSRRLHHR